MLLSSLHSPLCFLHRHLACWSFLGFFISGMAFLLTNVGCGHITPYYGLDVSWRAVDTPTNAEVRQRILLIGDVGESDESVLHTLCQWAKILPDKTLIIFLGDNIYPKGMPDAEDSSARREAERRLRAQVSVVQESGACGLFLPGNHDWAEGSADGLKAVLEQAEYINQKLPRSEDILPQRRCLDPMMPPVADNVAGMGTAMFLPTPGCPGPAKVDLEGVRIIVLDTQWWLHKHQKSTEMCVADEDKRLLQSLEPHDAIKVVKEIVIKKLQEYVNTDRGGEVIVVAHHPLATHGLHGGFYTWQDHLFPLTRLVQWLWIPTPIVGSLYPLGRWHWVRIRSGSHRSQQSRHGATIPRGSAGYPITSKTPHVCSGT